MSATQSQSNPPSNPSSNPPPTLSSNSAFNISGVTWVLFPCFITTIAAGATIQTPKWASVSFFGLATIIGIAALWLAIRERNWFVGALSAVATLVVASLFISQGKDIVPLWFIPLLSDHPFLTATLTATLATIPLITALLVWRKKLFPGLFPPVQPRPAALPFSFHTDAPVPLEARFVGRQTELAELDTAWASALADVPAPNTPAPDNPTRTVGIIAWGGFGKSTLARQWLWQRFEQPDAEDKPEALFWHAFQEGEGADAFALSLIGYLSGQPGLQLQDLPPGDSQRMDLLRRAMGGRRYVLVLDGLEVEQGAGGGDGQGRLQSGFLRGLLKDHSAGRLGQGLILVTSRLPLIDIQASSGYRLMDLEAKKRALSDRDARRLLENEGVTDCSEAELAELLRFSGRQPLALKAMAGFLAVHNGGKAKGWQRFRPDVVRIPRGREKEEHLWQVLTWTDGVLNANQRRVLNTLAWFREPVAGDWLRHLLTPRDAPALPQKEADSESAAEQRLREILARPGEDEAKTKAFLQALQEETGGDEAKLEALLGKLRGQTGSAPIYTPEELALPGLAMTGPELRRALGSLVRLRLLRREPTKQGNNRYAMHGLIRDHFQTPALDPPAIHLRIYRLYAGVIQPVWRPDGLEGLRPLYEAVHHGARAGLHQEALYDVYVARILRGTGHDGFYSTRKLGAVSADLAAVKNFFTEPWIKPAPELKPADQAWLLNAAAFSLRALGRFDEALAPMRVGLERRVAQEDWENAAISASNLSELELTLGRVAAAVSDGARSVEYAESGDKLWKMLSRVTHADALHQHGDRAGARRLFEAAEAIQQDRQPTYPRLYSLQGFQYADLLLGAAERAAWARTFGGQALPVVGAREERIAACDAVTERANEAILIAKQNNWILDIALDRLTLARAGLYRALLATEGCHQPSPHCTVRFPEESRQTIAKHLDAAVDGLRKSGQMDDLPRGLLTRAWFRALTGDDAGARADLDEAWDLARGAPLHQTDILLTRARLFHHQDPTRARTDLARARTLIHKHGYHRRDQELTDAEAVIGTAQTP